MIDQARIRFALDHAGEVRVAIYDLGGRLVRTLVAGEREAGEHQAHWDRRDDLGRRTPGGVYFVKLKTAGRMTSTPLVTLP